jgi:hypothetical protein
LQIYHNGTNSIISDEGAGALVVQSNGSGIYLNNGVSENMLTAVIDGAVTLYHDNSPKLATTATGISVTGTVVADGLTVDKTATISTTDYYAASTFSSVLKGASTNTKAALLLNSVSSSGQNAFASIHSEPVADFRASLIGTYSADGSGAGYFAINQFLPSSSATQERLRIDSSGNVGIGVTPSASSACANLELPYGATLSARSNTTAPQFAMMSNAVGNWYEPTYKINGYATRYVQQGNDGTHVWSTAASGTAGDAISFSTAMRIDSSGSINLGVTTPTHGVDSLVIYQPDNYALYSGSDGTGVSNHIVFGNANSWVGSITTNGSSTAYNTSSDYRLKEDDVPMTGATERVKALRPINFAWKSDGSRVDGFLAHEVQEIVPEAISGTKDAMRDEEYEVTAAVEATYDEDGNELTAAVEAVMGTRSVPDMQGIDQSKLVPLLTAALQEALNKIADMEIRLAALENN